MLTWEKTGRTVGPEGSTVTYTAEEKLRQRAEQVSGIKIQYQHEAVLEKMREAGVESKIVMCDGVIQGGKNDDER